MKTFVIKKKGYFYSKKELGCPEKEYIDRNKITPEYLTLWAEACLEPNVGKYFEAICNVLVSDEAMLEAIEKKKKEIQNA